MGSYRCCTNREPPSPEGAAPRLVSTLPKPGNEPSKEPIPISSFSISSHFSKAEDAAGLKRTLEDNKSDDESGHNDLVPKKSSGTLSAVKTKLQRHLSRDSGLSKCNSRSSVGNSEEDIERRKELKRFLRQRIKAELSNESAYDDDDAKSVSTVGNRPENKPQISLQLSDSTEIPEVVLLRGMTQHSTLDSMCDMDEIISNTIRHDNEIFLTNPQANFAPNKQYDMAADHLIDTLVTSKSLGRRHSSAGFIVRSPNDIDLVLSKTRRSSTEYCMPPAPILLPQRLPSIADPATRRTSWRLSFTGESRASQLRNLSREHTPSIPDYQKIPNFSTTRVKWPDNQSLQLDSRVVANVEDEPNGINELITHKELCSTEKRFGGVDGGAESPGPIPLHEMEISRRLLSYASSPQLSSWGSRCNNHGSSNTSQGSHSTNSQHLRHVLGSGCLGPRVSKTWEAIFKEGASSFYQSTDEGSRLNLASRKSRSDTRESGGRVAEITEANSQSETSIKVVEVDTSNMTLDALINQQSRRLTIDSSIAQSETPSFQQREEELNIMEARFLPASKQKRWVTASINGKFKEEFGDSKITSHQKNSILSALQKTKISRLAYRSYDGENSQELIDELDAAGAFCQIPRGGFGRKIVKPPPVASRPEKTAEVNYEETEVDPFSVNDTETATSMWERAMKSHDQELLNRGAIFASGASFPDRNLLGGDKNTSVNNESRKSSGRSSGMRNIKMSKSSTSSWARFPSHSRGERSLTAGSPDKVEGKDFAIKEIVDGEPEYILHPRMHQFRHRRHHRGKHHLTISQRMQEKIRLSFYKLLASPNIPTNATIDGRRGSMTLTGRIEDPELEIIALPLDEEVTGELADLEGDIAAEMRQEERRRRMWKMGDFADGSVDDEGKDSMNVGGTYEISDISIADPRFYDDCLIEPPFDVDDLRSAYSEETIRVENLIVMDRDILKRSKHKTWSGRDRVTKEWLGSLALRKSTIDFTEQLEMMERMEKDRVIKSAEDAWGT